MNPKAKNSDESDASQYYEFFNEPQTIPAGWEVSAFYAPERENINRYGSERHQYEAASSNKLNDHAQDSL
jgi:hypothetical protein